MFTDVMHNSIVAAMVTPAFLDRVKEELLPLLEEKYGAELMGICMYEEFLDPSLTKDGFYHYPMTVILPEPRRQWVRWNVSAKKRFDKGIPYSYLGTEPLGFELCDVVSPDMEALTEGKALYYSSKALKLGVHAESVDPLFMVGKYSQTFVDEMASQLTSAIRRLMGVDGLENTEIELSLMFASGTYMEHTSENVTYRRLLMSDKSCQARDFWVKWTRLDGHIAYSVADDVSPESILFEIGEDVPQKIREKEFRFLCRIDPSKYQSAMGKKTATEWRDIIKRAIRRGDLVKTVGDPRPAGKAAVEEDEITRLAREAIAEYERRQRHQEQQAAEASNASVQTEEAIPVETLQAEQTAEEQTVTVGALNTEEDIPFGLDLTDDDESVEEQPAEDAENVADEAAEQTVEAAPVETVEELTVVEQAPVEAVEEQTELLREDKPVDADAISREEYARQMAIKLEEERILKERAEAEKRAELEAMRRELEESLRREYEAKAEQVRQAHLAEQERIRNEERDRAQEMLRAQNEELRRARSLAEENERIQREAQDLKDEIARKDKRELKERELIAEAARIAVEEQRRIEAEKRAVEEQRRLAEEEKLRAEEERRKAQERELERQRLLRQSEAARAETERLKQEAMRHAAQQSAPARPAVSEDPEPYFIERSAKILFRDDVVDLNVIKKIKDIVERTLILEKKEDLRIFMKAYPREQSVIVLDVKLPKDEQPLLITIIKAIGNGGLGVTKITLE